jgi:cytochrome b561
MRYFARRLRQNAALTVLASLALVTLYAVYRASLAHENFVTGWLLAAATVALVLYNLRRGIPVLPLGSSSVWMQFHAYLGVVAIVLFLLHVGVKLPRGFMEIVLAGLFGLVAGSGVVGFGLARLLPARLSRRGEEVLYERIPQFRRQLLERAEALALRAVEETGSTTIADYYADRLRPFLDGPRNFWEHVFEVSRGRQNLLVEMRDLERYLDDNEKQILRELARLIEVKDDLDYQYALQSILKRWQFVHVPLAYGLIVFIALHMVVVYAFA